MGKVLLALIMLFSVGCMPYTSDEEVMREYNSEQENKEESLQCFEHCQELNMNTAETYYDDCRCSIPNAMLEEADDEQKQ